MYLSAALWSDVFLERNNPGYRSDGNQIHTLTAMIEAWSIMGSTLQYFWWFKHWTENWGWVLFPPSFLDFLDIQQLNSTHSCSHWEVAKCQPHVPKVTLQTVFKQYIVCPTMTMVLKHGYHNSKGMKSDVLYQYLHVLGFPPIN